jgi:hypothetical protein
MFVEVFPIKRFEPSIWRLGAGNATANRDEKDLKNSAHAKQIPNPPMATKDFSKDCWKNRHTQLSGNFAKRLVQRSEGCSAA